MVHIFKIIEELSNIPLEFSPGSFYNYSISIDILGFIIERISNKTLNEYLHENIFNTLGMKDTAFTLDTSKTERLAMCYRWDENKNKYEKYPLHKSHSEHGFIEPLKYFNPSIGISQIIGLDNENQYVVASLKAHSLYFFEY